MQHIEGELTTRDAKRTIKHRVVVPPGTATLDIVFRFAPAVVRGAKNLITLTLFGPQGETPSGFRGAGHRDGEPGETEDTSVHRVRLGPVEATPGYIAGPLTPGDWTVELDTHMIMPGPPVHYALDVSPVPGVTTMAAEVRAPAAGGDDARPGWYRGDLHTHTYHSDAAGFTVTQLLASAADAGLDFVFLTDHNTTSGIPPAPDDLDPGGMPRLFPGLELTTYWGHALCLGARDWVDWRAAPGSGGMARVCRELEAVGGLFVIAHPGSVGDPWCTGCAWRFGEMMPDGAGCVEVWNGPWAGDSGNEAALSLWYDWLNQGYRLTATAGTDTHGAGDYKPDGHEGLPGFSLVRASALTMTALLDGLRRGLCYLSAGPGLDLVVEGCSGVWGIGDTVSEPAVLRLAWDGCPAGAQGRLLANGRLLDAWGCEESGQRAWPLTPDSADWLVVEIRDAAGRMLAVTNPVWLASKEIRRVG